MSDKNAVQGAGWPQDWLRKPYIDDVFGSVDDLPRSGRSGPILGAEGLRYAMDAMRRKGKRIGGFTTWDFNEPWTNGAGSYMVDYDGRPLMNYDFVKQALSPVSLSLQYDSVPIQPRPGPAGGTFPHQRRPAIRRRTANGTGWPGTGVAVIRQDEGTASIDPLETKSLAPSNFKPPQKTAFGPVFLEFRLLKTHAEICWANDCIFLV